MDNVLDHLNRPQMKSSLLSLNYYLQRVERVGLTQDMKARLIIMLVLSSNSCPCQLFNHRRCYDATPYICISRRRLKTEISAIPSVSQSLHTFTREWEYDMFINNEPGSQIFKAAPLVQQVKLVRSTRDLPRRA